MRAKLGDQIIVGVRTPERPGRRGQVMDVFGDGADTRYLVRWQDGRETLLYPGPDARVITAVTP